MIKKRPKKESDNNKQAAPSKGAPSSPSNHKPISHFFLVSSAGSILGVLLTLIIVFLFYYASGNSQFKDEVIAARGAQYQHQLNLQIAVIEQTVNGLGKNLDVISALEEKNQDKLRQLEKALTASTPHAVQVRFRKRDDDSLASDGTVPMNYAARDMARKSERGQQVPAEIHKIEGAPYVIATARIKPEQGPVLGAVITVFDLSVLTNAFQSIPANQGQVALQQQFNANQQPQNQLTYGQATSGESPVILQSNNAYWQLSYTSSDLSNKLPLSILWIIIAAIIALTCIAVTTWLAMNMLTKASRADAASLVTFLEARMAQKRKTVNCQLDLFHNIALSLEQLFKDQFRPAVTKSKSQPEIDDSVKSTPPTSDNIAPSTSSVADEINNFNFANPLFQSTDMLDIEELDEDGSDNQPEDTQVEVPASIFRAYDIRGVVGDTLTFETATLIGKAIGSEAQARGEKCVIVGADGRLSSPEVSQNLMQGIISTGCDVISIGMVPTPVLYFATHIIDESNSGVMVTGSHNPPDYNGFKTVLAGKTLANEDIQQLYQRIKENNLQQGQGSLIEVDVLESYVERIRNDIALAKPLKVVVDCGNGVGGVIAPRLLEDLGCNVIPLYCDVDGNFPNHHPDPGKPENLKDLIAKVKETKADLGLGFDGDADRVGVITNEGKLIYPDRLLMLFAKDVVSRNPGADIIFDVKCTRKLTGLISGYGGRPIMWKTGHSLIKAKMKETGALLAGEMSGHIFFKERWYGFDDGIYSAARLLEILSTETRNADQIFASFPETISTPEINIQVTDENKFDLVDQLAKQGNFGKGTITDIDGVRVDFPVGWGLVRASNTTPVLVLRFEADTEENLKKIKALFKKQLLAVDSSLDIPF